MYHAVPAPDLAIYSGGLYFESTNEFRDFDFVVIIRNRLSKPASLILPDGAVVAVDAVSLDTLRNHEVKCYVSGDDGEGNFRVATDSAMYLSFRANRAEWISLGTNEFLRQHVRLSFNDREIFVPITRKELESLIGAPDETKLDTVPPDR